MRNLEKREKRERQSFVADCITADLHLGHGNILKYCNRPGLSKVEQEMLAEKKAWEADKRRNPSLKTPEPPDFKVSRESVRVMDNYLIDGINKMVGAGDRLRIIGDFCFCDRKFLHETVQRYLQRINCKNVHLVYGNHDEDGYTDEGEAGPYYPENDIGQNFTSSCHYDEFKINGQKIVLFHYAGVVWNKSHHGAWFLCGHSHATLNPWLNKNMGNAKIMDVGVDHAAKLFGEYRSFTLDEIRNYMNAKRGHSLDHHTSAENPS